MSLNYAAGDVTAPRIVKGETPLPGTVLFFGYGNSLADLDDTSDRRNFERLNDSFFLKASYLFRM